MMTLGTRILRTLRDDDICLAVKMKIIFLDIDGVLNSSQWYDSLDGPAVTMDSDIDDKALSLLINYIKRMILVLSLLRHGGKVH